MNSKPKEPTVEEALAELRAMFPARRVCVQRKEGLSSEPASAEVRGFVYYRVFVNPRNWRKPTLRECMVQVRKWKENQQ